MVSARLRMIRSFKVFFFAVVVVAFKMGEKTACYVLMEMS